MMRDGQPQSGAAKSARSGGIALGKRGEQTRLGLLVHADAVIRYLKFHCYLIRAAVHQQRTH